MNIYIYHCSNTFNYGSMMMGENFITYFNKATGQINDYYVETEDEINIQRLRSAAQCDRIFSVPFNSLFIDGFNKYDYLLSLMSLKKAVSDFSKKIDLVVVLGGDDFTEDYGWKAPLLYGIQFCLLRREGSCLVMLGQTMGPFHSFRGAVMKHLLSRINRIYPRDRLTYQYLKGLGLKNLSMTDDLALLPLTKQMEAERSEEYIILCPSELIARYCKEGGRDEWMEYNLFLIETILKRYPEKILVLLAHVLKPEHVDDRRAVNDLYNRLKPEDRDRTIAVNTVLYPWEVRSYIQKACFVVSARMHAVVSSLQCGIPALALSYSSKFWGIIGDRYGLSDYILDVRYLNYEEMREKFVQMIDQMEKESLKIKSGLEKNNALVERSILSALDEIRDLCGKTEIHRQFGCEEAWVEGRELI